MSHIHEKIDFTVEVFIVYQNKVLLRKHDKYGIWLSVGGHIELHEDPNQAAYREVKEETGLEIELWDSRKANNSDDFYNELIPPISMGRHQANETHEHIPMVYFARAKSDHVEATYEDDKSEECKWCSKEELETMDLRPNVTYYAKLALETLHD